MIHMAKSPEFWDVSLNSRLLPSSKVRPLASIYVREKMQVKLSILRNVCTWVHFPLRKVTQPCRHTPLLESPQHLNRGREDSSVGSFPLIKKKKINLFTSTKNFPKPRTSLCLNFMNYSCCFKWERSDLIMFWGGIFPTIKWKISSFVYWAVLRTGYHGLSTELYMLKTKEGSLDQHKGNKYETRQSFPYPHGACFY